MQIPRFKNVLFLFFVLPFFSTSASYGQNAAAQLVNDSLRQILKNTDEDNQRYAILLTLAKQYDVIPPEEAKRYGYDLLEIAHEQADNFKIAESWTMLSSVFSEARELDSTEISARKALEIIGDNTEPKFLFLKADAWLNLGGYYYRSGNFDAAIEAYETSLAVPSIQIEQEIRVASNLSVILNELGKHDEAMLYAKKTLEYAQDTKNKAMQGKALSNLANIHYSIRDYDRAISLERQALNLRRELSNKHDELYSLYTLSIIYYEKGPPDSCYYYGKKLLETSEALQQDFWQFRALFILILNERYLESVDTRSFIRKAEQLMRSTTNLSDLDYIDMQAALSEYHFYKERYPEAIDHAQKSLGRVREIDSDTSFLLTNALLALSEAQYKAGQYKLASETQKELYLVTTALNKRNQLENLSKTAVELELAENALARQKAEQATLLEQQTSTARTRFFALLLLLAGLIVVGVAWAYRHAQRDKQLIQEKNVLVEQSLAEKEVLLREIHHRVKNNLQIISSLLDKQARKSSDKAVRKLVKEGQERIQSMALIHQNLYESEQIGNIDIKAYLQELSLNIQKSQAISVDRVVLELNVTDEKLDIDTAIPMGLILNELLTNSYKYAFAENRNGKIQVDFNKKDGEYFLQVSDDGVGFTPEQAAAKTKSLGLNLVNGLVRQLDGTIEWLKVMEGAAVVIKF